MPDLTHATAEEVAAEVEEVGYAVVPNFINADRVAALLRTGSSPIYSMASGASTRSR